MHSNSSGGSKRKVTAEFLPEGGAGTVRGTVGRETGAGAVCTAVAVVLVTDATVIEESTRVCREVA